MSQELITSWPRNARPASRGTETGKTQCAYAALAGVYERLRDRASLREVRRGLSRAIHRIWRLAQRERDHRERQGVQRGDEDVYCAHPVG
jgi:hypothetical protein